MERKTKPASFIAYSQKTCSALIDQGNGEVWWPVSPPVSKFISKVSKGEVEFEQDETGQIVYIKNTGVKPSGEFQPANKQFGDKVLNELKNDTNKSIESQVIFKGAIELTKVQMEMAASKNNIVETDVAMDINIRLCADMLKLAKSL